MSKKLTKKEREILAGTGPKKLSKLDIARAALEEIINPVETLRKRVAPEGRVLSHMANSICNSGPYLQDIARKAVKDMDGTTEGHT